MIAFEYVNRYAPQHREEVIFQINQFTERHRAVYGRDLDAEFSFGHIVLSDHNLEDDFILPCLHDYMIDDWYQQRVKDMLNNPKDFYPTSFIDAARDDVIIFLRWLLTIPEGIRSEEEGEGDDD